MINSKWIKTFSRIICNEKKASWTQIAFHCKARFGIVRMLTKTLQDLDLYSTMDHTQMKAIDVNYSVRVGYWALRNNVQEYKVYVIVIWMFNLDLWTTCDKFLEIIYGQLN